MENPTILYKPIHPFGKLIPPAYDGDAGMNVCVVNDCVLERHTLTKVDIGISIAVPKNMFVTFLTRSSAVGNGLFVMPTLIDSGYRGPLFLFVYNMGKYSLKLERGISIAQMILVDNHMPANIQQVDELPASERGTKSFGSSGNGVS